MEVYFGICRIGIYLPHLGGPCNVLQRSISKQFWFAACCINTCNNNRSGLKASNEPRLRQFVLIINHRMPRHTYISSTQIGRDVAQTARALVYHANIHLQWTEHHKCHLNMLFRAFPRILKFSNPRLEGLAKRSLCLQ